MGLRSGLWYERTCVCDCVVRPAWHCRRVRVFIHIFEDFLTSFLYFFSDVFSSVQASTAVVVGSPRDAAAAAADRKLRQPRSPRADASPLQSAKSLDSSGVIKKHLVHLESMFRPGAGDAHLQQLRKSVQLRKPRPLRKAQTVDLTRHVGIGVDPELMQLLRTRKEKSASDDEDAKPRDDAAAATARSAMP